MSDSVRKFFYKPAIITYFFQKVTNLLDRGQFLPSQRCLNFFETRWYFIHWYDVSYKGSLLELEHTLTQFCIQFLLPENLQNLSQAVSVFFSTLWIDHDIIDKYIDKLIQ